MTANQLMFILFALMIIVFSILTVTSGKILRAAVYLLFVLVSTSGLYFMLNYQFLAAIQLTLYAGGIVVLNFESLGWKKNIFSAIAAVTGAILSIVTLLDYKFAATTEAAKEVDMRLIGKSFLSMDTDGYILPFEVISVLLLAAMISAIVIAKKSSPAKTKSPTYNQK
jgi:NADH-quinone oxidoreductase subunit J